MESYPVALLGVLNVAVGEIDAPNLVGEALKRDRSNRPV